MLITVLAMTLLFTDTAQDNPIQAVIERYRNVPSYQVTLTSLSRGKTEIIRYFFMKPGFVRMEFLTPFKGAVVIYDPGTKHAKVWPFGYGSFPALSFSPDNSLIQSSTGQRVDRSDVGALYDNVRKLQEHGTTEIVGIEHIGDDEALHVNIKAGGNHAIEKVARYDLWLDSASGFPFRVVSYDIRGEVLEAVEMGELKIAPELPVGFFKH